MPLHLLQLVGGRRHGRGSGLHVVPKAVEFLIGRRQIPAVHARCERQGLFLQLALHTGKELARFRRVFGRGALVVLPLPGCGDQLFLAFGDVGLASHPAAATAAATHLLRLRELALERVCLDKRHVGARFRMSILGRGIKANQVSRNQLEIFQAQRRRAAHVLRARLVVAAQPFFRSTVDGIVEAHLVQAKLDPMPSRRR